MSAPEIPDQDELEIPRERIEREEMVKYLTAGGKIRKKVANDLYDAGVDNWHSLANGDEGFFRSYRNVGKKTAEVLVELGQNKRKEIESRREAPSLDDVLQEIPRVTPAVVESLKKNGYDSFGKFKDMDPEELRSLKWIGPKLSVTIVEKVNEARETYGITDDIAEAEIEDAVGSQEAEKPVEEGSREDNGFFQRLIAGIKSIFSGKKDEEPVEQDKEDDDPGKGSEGEEIEEEVVEEIAPEPLEEPMEDSDLEDKEETREKEVPSVDEVKKVMEPEEETPREEKEEISPEPVKQEKGFFLMLKEKIFGPPAEGSAEEEPEQPKENREPEAKEEQETSSLNEEGSLGLDGISEDIQEKLRGSGYLNVDELKEAVPEDLVMIEGIDEETAKRICDAARS